MKYETIHNVTLPKIGFGTWKIGGGSSPDPRLDSVSLAALHSALEIGYTHFFAGPFIENTGPADDADFFYVATTLKL